MLADSMRWAFSDEETLFMKGCGLADVIKKNENSCPLFLDIDLRGINLSLIQEGDLLGLIDRGTQCLRDYIESNLQVRRPKAHRFFCT